MIDGLLRPADATEELPVSSAGCSLRPHSLRAFGLRPYSAESPTPTGQRHPMRCLAHREILPCQSHQQTAIRYIKQQMSTGVNEVCRVRFEGRRGLGRYVRRMLGSSMLPVIWTGENLGI